MSLKITNIAIFSDKGDEGVNLGKMHFKLKTLVMVQDHSELHETIECYLNWR